jgi:Zn-dependent protease|tara:strand:- start:538 stop:1380 length:843 start_codon:yes stop_codon:yes gene_type:complete
MTEKRDPRAHWLDEDPFDQMNNNSKTHTRTRDDGNWRKPHIRVVHANISGQPFFRSFNPQQSQKIPVHKGSIWHFSKTEIEHLTQATMAFALALAFMTTGGIFGAFSNIRIFIIGGSLCFFALVPSFLLHEIAHKVVARSYGCWAEFRASPAGLRFGVIIAAAFGIVFMAPGAVMVAGNTTKSQWGKIALAGPLTNVGLWLIGLLMVFMGFNQLNEYSGTIMYWWMWGNAGLATFNMLPIWQLDGKKIKIWSDIVYYFWLIVCISLIWFNLKFLEFQTIF